MYSRQKWFSVAVATVNLNQLTRKIKLKNDFMTNTKIFFNYFAQKSYNSQYAEKFVTEP